MAAHGGVLNRLSFDKRLKDGFGLGKRDAERFVIAAAEVGLGKRLSHREDERLIGVRNFPHGRAALLLLFLFDCVLFLESFDCHF